MLQTGIRELKSHLSMYLRKVREGNVVTITDHGDAIALMTPTKLDSKVRKKLQPLVSSGAIVGMGGKPSGIEHPVNLSKSQWLSSAILEERR